MEIDEDPEEVAQPTGEEETEESTSTKRAKSKKIKNPDDIEQDNEELESKLKERSERRRKKKHSNEENEGIEGVRVRDKKTKFKKTPTEFKDPILAAIVKGLQVRLLKELVQILVSHFIYLQDDMDSVTGGGDGTDDEFSRYVLFYTCFFQYFNKNFKGHLLQ